MSQFITFLGDDLINALGWTFVHTLWQGCVIVLLMIFVLQRIPTKNAVLRYTIATASMFSMLVAAVATFALLYFEPGQSGPIASSAAAQNVVVGESGGFSLINWLGNHLSAMVAIWIVGVVLLACRMLFGLAYIQYLRNTASDLSFKLGSRVEAIAKEINYKRPLDIAESALVQIPVVVGYLKPMILFPIGAINQLTNDEVEAVLAHEIAHLVRNDFLQNIVQSVIEIIFYYHPAVWWISAVVRSERENCCDDLAIEVCGSSFTYARALVRLQEVGQSAPALALPFLGSKNHLLNRVKRILNEPHNKSNLMEKITATGLLLLCLVFASFNEGTEEAQRTTVDVPELIEYKQRVHLVSMTVRDTIIPTKSHTIVIEETNGKEVRLEIENGEIRNLNINGEEIPESRYGEYTEYINQLQSQLPTPPLAPTTPTPPTPSLAPVPPSPVAAPVPPTPPRAPLPLMPPNAQSAPRPTAPPSPPNVQGVLFEFDGEFDYAPYVLKHDITKTRTESTIIREIDENGNITYRIDGDHADDTTIRIDYAAGTAIIDDQEIIIDADSIIIIEEIETGHKGYAFMVAPNLSSDESFQHIARFEMNDNLHSIEYTKLWNEQSKTLIEYNDNLNIQMNDYEWVFENDGLNNAQINEEIISNARIKQLKEAQELYLIHTSSDSNETTVRLFEHYDIARKEYKALKTEDVESAEAMRKELEFRVKATQGKPSSKKDQSGLIDTEIERTYVLNSDDDGNVKIVTLNVNTDVSNNVTWVADVAHVDSDEQVITLTGNVELEATDEAGNDIHIEADEMTYEFIETTDIIGAKQDYEVVIKEVVRTDAEGNEVEGEVAYKVLVQESTTQGKGQFQKKKTIKNQ